MRNHDRESEIQAAREAVIRTALAWRSADIDHLTAVTEAMASGTMQEQHEALLAISSGAERARREARDATSDLAGLLPAR